MKTFGRVRLAGAGPGDISLPTLKAVMCIKQADIIIYDRLINPKILEWALPNCLFVNAGKDPGSHCVPQDEINALLVQYAQTHNNIVRLRGGDPYVFGRGAERVEDLVETGIPSGVMLGISSTIGGPTYTGIPVTHYGFASGFHVVTGYTRGGNQQQGWRRLAKLDGTLVIIMGTANPAPIYEELLMGGESTDTPAALIMSAVRNSQRRLTYAFGSLPSKAQEANILPPTLTVIGGVVTLSDWLSFIPKVITPPESLHCDSLARRKDRGDV